MSALPVIAPPTSEIPTCCGAPASSGPVTTLFHFSLNVRDLAKSVAFYEKLFGEPPAKSYPDYAKFELKQPPLVFSLVRNAPASKGALSHLGFPVKSTDEVEAVGRRLEQAGLAVCNQNGTVCGYARQDKVWVADPDQNYWEVYVVHEDIDPKTINRAFDGASLPEAIDECGTVEAPVRHETNLIWEHRVTDDSVDSVPYEDGEVGEVRLTGTFNSALIDERRSKLLKDAWRALKPGGTVQVHGLVSSRPITGTLPPLPGVASLVKRIPTEGQPLEELRAAGFVEGRITKLLSAPIFTGPGVEMREIKVSAKKPVVIKPTGAERAVVYKGPFAEARDDRGTVFRRGARVGVSEEQWQSLQTSGAAKQFVFLKSEPAAGCG